MAGDLDFGLGDVADAIRETTHRFASDRIAPIAAYIDSSNSFAPVSSGPKWARLACTGLPLKKISAA